MISRISEDCPVPGKSHKRRQGNLSGEKKVNNKYKLDGGILYNKKAQDNAFIAAVSVVW